MTLSQMRKKSIAAVNKRGCLLVYPLHNRKEPNSIWAELFPRTKMVWDWNEDADDRVADMWSIREQLSRSREVVYAKWYQNRATFFSFEAFILLLAILRGAWPERLELGPESRDILDFLTADSPLSTKQVKAAAGLEGRLNEPAFNRAMKPLWSRLAIVGFGEFEDSSFPSLGIGASATLFEDLVLEARTRDPEKSLSELKALLGEDNLFYRYALKLR